MGTVISSLKTFLTDKGLVTTVNHEINTRWFSESVSFVS